MDKTLDELVEMYGLTLTKENLIYIFIEDAEHGESTFAPIDPSDTPKYVLVTKEEFVNLVFGDWNEPNHVENILLNWEDTKEKVEYIPEIPDGN